jgi:hypothetical protein
MHKKIARLNQWRDLSKIETYSEDPEVIAGRQAEQFLMQIVETNLKWKNAYCYLSKRFPSKKHGRRFEIDLVVLTKKHLHFLEIKNWSGEVISSGSNWIQIRRNGEKIEHPNLVDYNSVKQQVVIEFLRERGLILNKTYFSQLVIFINPNLKLDPVIDENPFVVPYKNLNKYLASQRGVSFAERMVHSMIEICLNLEKSKIVMDGLFHAMPSSYFIKIRDHFMRLGTWDKVGLYGDKVLTGDVLKLFIGKREVDLGMLSPGEKIQLSWTRNKIWGLVKSLATDYSLGTLNMRGERIPIHTKDSMKFHAAGEEKPVKFDLSHIEWILKG